MKKYIERTIALCVICLFLVAFAAAQSNDNEGKNEFSVWSGFSPVSSTLIRGTARMPDTRLGIFAVRYAHRFNNNDTINLRYTFDVIPALVLNFPDFVAVGKPPAYRLSNNVRATRYAFGVSPFGLRMNFRPRKKVQPYADATGGLLFFNKDVPSLVGVQLGFTAHVGGGVEYNLKNSKSVEFGYKYFHVSNANRGKQNPGFDNNLFYIGYTFSKR